MRLGTQIEESTDLAPSIDESIRPVGNGFDDLQPSSSRPVFVWGKRDRHADSTRRVGDIQIQLASTQVEDNLDLVAGLAGMSDCIADELGSNQETVAERLAVDAGTCEQTLE
jgi:hypothetical protein